MKRHLCLALAALTLSTSGCCTLLSVAFDDQHRWDVFVGVRADAAIMWRQPLPLAALAALDLPLSLVADLTLLPVTSARGAAAHFEEKGSPAE